MTRHFFWALALLCLPWGAFAEQPVAGYDKGFFIRTPDKPYELKVRALVQTRLGVELPEEGEAGSAFSVPRARLKLYGQAFHPDLRLYFQADFAKGGVGLRDYWAEYTVVKGWLQVRAGQGKIPFARHQVTSTSQLELLDSAPLQVGNAREIGFLLHNGHPGSGLEWAVGLHNGTGIKKLGSSSSNVPDRFHPELVARIGYNHGGIKGYSEADLEGGPFRIAVALAGIADFDWDGDNSSVIWGTADVHLKAHGFSAMGAFFLGSMQSGDSFTDRALDEKGYFLRAGYVIAGRFQPLLQFAHALPKAPSQAWMEATAAFSVYVFGHDVKWQTEATMVRRESRNDWRVRTQLQAGF